MVGDDWRKLDRELFDLVNDENNCFLGYRVKDSYPSITIIIKIISQEAYLLEILSGFNLSDFLKSILPDNQIFNLEII